MPAAVCCLVSPTTGLPYSGDELGGLGTPIASMASLISLKIATASGLVGKRRYLAVFTAWNVAFLAVLCAANAVFGWA